MVWLLWKETNPLFNFIERDQRLQLSECSAHILFKCFCCHYFLLAVIGDSNSCDCWLVQALSLLGFIVSFIFILYWLF
jgi:hypothetical protein